MKKVSIFSLLLVVITLAVFRSILQIMIQKN